VQVVEEVGDQAGYLFRALQVRGVAGVLPNCRAAAERAGELRGLRIV
jgi:hypothetical protein